LKGRARWIVRIQRAAATASAIAFLGVTAGASAQDLQTTTTGATTTTASAQDLAASSDGGSSGSTTLTLRSENVSPSRVFFAGTRKAAYAFTIGGSRARDVTVQVVNRDIHEAVRRWTKAVEPDSEARVRWDGTLSDGSPARKGDYVFRVRDSNGDPAERTRAAKRTGSRRFGLFPFKFPVRGRHTYGDGVGAPRAGHRHQGQDILAACGTRLASARGGRVQYNGHQASGAGNYLVIDGKRTSHDYVYMHMRRRSQLHRGDRVKTGQKIGRVGATGDASGCHLHMEEWAGPGWYEGGHFMRAITKHLRRWDRWS
jgi:murein DD-endopeptidase MepM/ murein hydrolase activator NlpD